MLPTTKGWKSCHDICLVTHASPLGFIHLHGHLAVLLLQQGLMQSTCNGFGARILGGLL